MTFIQVTPGSASPLIEVAIDFDNDPTSGTITWTDVSGDVVSYSRQPVRTNELDQPGGASASLKLRNDSGAYFPDNAAGPYFGKLKKLRRVRVRAQWAGVTYNRFWGYVEDWPASWGDAGGRDQQVTLQLSDGFEPLKTYDLMGRDFPGTLTGAAIGQVLTAAGITAQNLDAGNDPIPDSGTLATGSMALQRLNDIAASESGICFADGGGTIQFHDRHRRILAETSPQMATIGDTFGASIRYTNPQPIFGDAWPIVAVTPAGGTTEVTTIQAGTASFFQRTLNWPTAGQYLVGDQAVARAASQYLASRYAAPVTRITSVELIGAHNPTFWPSILAIDTSTRISFRRRLLQAGTVAGTLLVDGFAEGYGDQVMIGQDWRVLVPITPGTINAFWLLADTTYGVLGVTTIPAY